MAFVTHIVKSIADCLIYLAPLDAHEKHFFLSAEEHVIQAFWFLLACFVAIYASKFGTIAVPSTKKVAPLNFLEWLLRTVLTVNLVLQLTYKSLRGWRVLTYMFQPCHATTTLYLYCMYSKDYKRATQAFQIGLHYMFFTTLAIAVPDTTQLHLPFEVLNFWVQHYALLLAPLYLLATRRFELAPSWALSSYSIGVGMLFHFVTQLPAALLSGVNVNYMLWPPPGVPGIFNTTMWRVYLTCIFIPLAWMTGYLLPKLVLKVQREELAKAKAHHQKEVLHKTK